MEMPENNQSQASKPSAEGRMSVMPEQYVPKVKKGFSLKTIIIALSSFIVLALIVVAILVFTQPDEPTTVVQEQQPPVRQVQEEPEEEEEETEEEVLDDTELVSESDVTIPDLPLTPIPDALDTDQDGLSDVEEALFATSVSVPDTDSDGFLDGSEVVNLYDPATPVAFLEVSPRVKVARNDVKGFQFLVPASWVVTKQTPSAEAMVVSHSEGTETFHFEVIENQERLSAIEWYRSEVPAADVTAFVNFENEAGWKGIQSRDGRLVIATFGETGPGARAFIFLLYYDLGQEAEITYGTVWQMMLKSMAILEVEQQTSTQD